MFRNYLLTALRNAWKNKAFSAINITGQRMTIIPGSRLLKIRAPAIIAGAVFIPPLNS